MSRADGSGELERLSRLRDELDIDPESLRSTLEVSLGRPLEGPDDRGRFQVPLTPAWRGLIDESLRLEEHGARGVVFDPRLFMTTNRNRPVFRPMKDTVLLHLGHPCSGDPSRRSPANATPEQTHWKSAVGACAAAWFPRARMR
jgi:hypothetical protein